jgi:hypothetical protein
MTALVTFAGVFGIICFILGYCCGDRDARYRFRHPPRVLPLVKGCFLSDKTPGRNTATCDPHDFSGEKPPNHLKP